MIWAWIGLAFALGALAGAVALLAVESVVDDDWRERWSRREDEDDG